MAEPRVKVACINWTRPDAPHAVSYVLIDGMARGDTYHPTWEQAMERAAYLADLQQSMKGPR